MRKSVECKELRVGKQLIEVPFNVTIKLEGQDLKVMGPLGKLSIKNPTEVKVDREGNGLLRFKKAEIRRVNQMHGLFSMKLSLNSSFGSLTGNMVVGASKGFEKRLQLIGVGYHEILERRDLVFNRGFSHPARMAIPESLLVKVEENIRIIVIRYDKSAIGQFAGSVRNWRPPEPYKGRGVKYANEVVRLKEGGSVKKK